MLLLLLEQLRLLFLVLVLLLGGLGLDRSWLLPLLLFLGGLLDLFFRLVVSFNFLADVVYKTLREARAILSCSCLFIPGHRRIAFVLDVLNDVRDLLLSGLFGGLLPLCIFLCCLLLRHKVVDLLLDNLVRLCWRLGCLIVDENDFFNFDILYNLHRFSDLRDWISDWLRFFLGLL